MYSYKKEVKIGDIRTERLIAWYRGKDTSPAQIDVELHKRCNMFCPPCSRQAAEHDINEESRRLEMPVEKWLSLVDEAADLGILIWNIEGACEPFALKEYTIPVMRRVKERGMYGIVTTNGTLLTKDDIRILVEIGWDRIHFSLDGHTADLNDYIRGKGNFVKTLKAIRILNRLKAEYGSESPMLNINTVINHRNFTKIPELVDFAEELKADFIFTEPLITYHDKARHMKLSSEDRQKLPAYIVKAKALADKYGIDNNFATKDKNLEDDLVKETSKIDTVILEDASRYEDPFLSVPCFKPWDNMAIKIDGKCGHCGLIVEGENVKNHSLSDIWFGRKMQDIRRKMLEKNLPEHCKNCCPSDITQRRRFRKKLLDSLENG